MQLITQLRRIYFYLIIFQSLAMNSASWAQESIPDKQIAPTPYCENLSLIDQAQVIDPLTDKLGPNEKVDRLVVSKTRRKLYLLSQGRVLREYTVVFGFGAQDGAKIRQGDGRTPEGLYKIELKNPKSNYNKALRVSYPDAADKAYAKKYKVRPGGDIMIHGFPVRPIDGLIPAEVKSIHPNRDWTQGCIGVTDQEITEIYQLVSVSTLIEICPLN